MPTPEGAAILGAPLPQSATEQRQTVRPWAGRYSGSGVFVSEVASTNVSRSFVIYRFTYPASLF